MFAFKQVVRSLTPRLQSTLASKINTVHPSSASSVPIRQSQQNPLLQAYFSSSSNLAAAVEKTEGLQSSLAESLADPPEPDVLYHMIEVEIRCSDAAVLRSYNKAITLAAQYLDLPIAHNEVGKRPHIKRWTVLKSRVGHRKHMVQYEVRTYHHKIQLERLTGSTADTFLEYIQRNIPEGVSMRVERVRMEKLPDHLLSPPSDN